MTVINFERNDCKKINGYLNAYLDGELPLQTIQEVLRHLESCQNCVREIAAREQVKKALQQAVKKDVAPFGLEQRIQRNLRQKRAESPVKFPRWVLAVAATVILSVLGLGIFQALQSGKRSRAFEQASLQNAAVLQVGLGNHLHCAIDKGLANKQFTEDEMNAKLGEFAGLVAQLQGQLPSTYQVAIGHRCKFNNRQFVHLILKDKEKVVSVTLTPKNDEAFSAASLATIIQAAGIDLHQARLSEYEVTGFDSNGYLAFVTSNLEKQDNLELASAIAPVIQVFLDKMKA
jgi:anti-sigma factor (TIGR02949 family)